MTKKLHVLAAAMAACAAGLTSLPSHAQLADSGLYVGGNVGQSRYKGDDIAPGVSTDRNDTGGKAFVGYEFHPNVALELGYANLGEATSSVGSVSGEGVFVDLVGKMPFTPQLSGLARVGVFEGKTDFSSPLGSDSDRKTQPKVGLGLQYDINKNVAVRAEWERYRFEAFGEKANTDLASVGVKFKF